MVLNYLIALAELIRNSSFFNFVILLLPYWLMLLLIAFLYLIYINIPVIRQQFNKVSKKGWLVLFLIFMLAFFVRMFVAPHVHLMYQDEAYNGSSAKSLLLFNKLGDCFYETPENVKCSAGYAYFFWHFVIAISYLLFGVSDYVAINASALFGSLSIVLLFLLTYLLFKNERTALWSAFMLSVFPLHILWSGTSQSNVFALFMMLVTLILFFIFFKTNHLDVELLAIMSLILTAHSRIEYLLSIPLIIFAYTLFFPRLKEKIKNKDFSAWMLFPIALPFLLAQFSIMFAGLNIIYTSSQFKLHSYFEIIKLMKGMYVPFIALALSIFGAVVLAVKKRKTFLFLTSWFLLFFIFYTSWHYDEQSRYFLISHWVLMVFSANGINTLFLFIHKNFKNKKIRKIIISLLTLTIVLSALIFLSERKDEFAWIRESELELCTRTPYLIQQDIKNNVCYIITNQEDAVTLAAGTTLKIVSGYTILNEKTAVDLFIKNAQCLFYYEGMCCFGERPNETLMECEEIPKMFNMSVYKEYKKENWTYTLYVINNRNEI